MKSITARVWLRIFLLFLIAFMCTSSVQGQEARSSVGTEFIFSFMPNTGDSYALELLITSEYSTVGSVNVPMLGQSYLFSVEPGVSTRVNIPISMAQLPGGQVSGYGIRVVAELPIALVGLNRRGSSSDAFLVLPVDSLGTEYISLSYPTHTTSQIAIVGTEDNTVVRVVAQGPTIGSAAGVENVVSLNAMETFLVGANYYGADLSGARIVSDKPIAVTSGARCVQIPLSVTACDHIVEMIPPIEQWGSSFFSYPLATRLRGDLIRVLASEDDTDVVINGSLVATLDQGSFYESIADTPTSIETSNPSLVAQYSLGSSYDGATGDPSMMLLVSNEQTLDAYTFTVPFAPTAFFLNFLTVVIKSSDVNSIRLNGAMPDVSNFSPIGDGVFSGGHIPVTPGGYSVQADSPFALYVYGFSSFDSYAYPGGMATNVINPIGGDYRNVRVISKLRTDGIELDLNSFVIAPESISEDEGVTSIEWFFPSFSIGDIRHLDYEVVATNLLPGETRTITNSLELSYQDINGIEHRRTLGQQQLQVLSSGFTLDVSTDRTEYTADQNIVVSARVANADDQDALASVEFEVRDANGVYVGSIASLPNLSLEGNSTLLLDAREFNPDALYVGDYLVHAVLKNQEGVVVVETSAPFTIVPTGTASLSAQIATDKAVYTRRDTLALAGRVASLAENQLFNDITLVARVLDSHGNLLWRESAPLLQLAPGAAEPIHYSVSLADAGPGSYSVELSAFSAAGALLASALSSFQVQDDILLSLDGSVTVVANELVAGESPSCTFAVTNLSAQSIEQQALSLRLVRIDEAQALFSAAHTVNLPAQNAVSFAPAFSALTQEGDYACVLEASVAGETSVLASALFSVKAAPVSLVGDIIPGEQSRLLVLVDEDQPITQLQSLLDDAGWFYTLVTSAAEFDLELQSGGYGIYAILAQNFSLSQAAQQRLANKVAHGDGLLMASGLGSQHPLLETALGIRVRTNEAYALSLQLQNNPLGQDWTHQFHEPLSVLNFAAEGAQVFGEYTYSAPGQGLNHPLGPLGAAGRYGNLVLDNHTSLSSTVEGRLAVGGNLNLQHFSVGDKLDPSRLHDVVTVGGNVVFPSGRVYYGHLLAGGSVAGVGDPVRFGMAPGALVQGGVDLAIDFDGERRYLQDLSTNLAALAPTGSVQLQWGGMTLNGDCSSSLQVFAVPATQLASIHTLSTQCIPANATLVINVQGTQASIQNMGMQALAPIRNRVLFNFPQAQSLKLTSVAIEGSILAPWALVDQPAGRVEGQVIVRAWHSTNWGYMSIHNRFFAGDLSAALGQADKNALSIHQHQAGKAVFAGFDWLALAASEGAGAELFAQLLTDALAVLNPEPLALPGRTLPLMLFTQNTGANNAEGRLRLTLTDTLAPIAMGNLAAGESPGEWIMPFSLPAGGSDYQWIYVRLPVTGQGAANAQWQTGSPQGWVTRHERSLPLSNQ